MAILTIVIGIIFVLLLFSLLATTIMELIASFLGLRGRNLVDALRNMLAYSDQDEKVLQAFQKNALYLQLSQRYGKASNSTHRPPSYIGADSFRSILFDVILQGNDLEKLQQLINDLPDDNLKQVLNQLLRDADYKLDAFETQIEAWYNSVMERAGGWYKRYTQKILVAVGLVIAVVFNVDTLTLYSQLESDPAKLQTIVQLAETFANTGDSLVYRDTASTANFNQNLDAIDELLENHIDALRSPLGLGWDGVDVSTYTAYDWLAKIIGYLVTALAISLGAPFWFDLLRKLVNIRSSGNKPA